MYAHETDRSVRSFKINSFGGVRYVHGIRPRQYRHPLEEAMQLIVSAGVAAPVIFFSTIEAVYWVSNDKHDIIFEIEMVNILVKEECESWVMHRVVAAVKRLMHSLATVFSLVCTL